MKYHVKLFSGAPDKVESDINKWLEEQTVEIVQISPAVALTAFPVQTSPLRSPVPEVSIQSKQLLLVTIIYKEVAQQ